MHNSFHSSENSKNDTTPNQPASNTRPLSIEGPSTSNSVASNELTSRAQPLPNQPRQPTNLQGLLKYAMDAAQSEDMGNRSQLYPLDKEVHIISSF